ncbi:copper chaperone PCu(A)C [Aestuariivirga sp.]|uniref:copper chaperone PCu(A)C n=1 Tax=Aestuariivirga sp. TaxID=2650926 RepID=UPI0035944E13
MHSVRWLAFSAVMAIAVAGPGAAHTIRRGDLEIIHPAIMAPHAMVDSTCAHVTIRNHGGATEVLLGARIRAANSVRLTASGPATNVSQRIEIAPGKTVDLRHGWCLLLSGITESLEPDMNVIPGELIFERAGTVSIDFMIDPAH